MPDYCLPALAHRPVRGNQRDGVDLEKTRGIGGDIVGGARNHLSLARQQQPTNLRIRRRIRGRKKIDHGLA